MKQMKEEVREEAFKAFSEEIADRGKTIRDTKSIIDAVRVSEMKNDVWEFWKTATSFVMGDLSWEPHCKNYSAVVLRKTGNKFRFLPTINVLALNLISLCCDATKP